MDRNNLNPKTMNQETAYHYTITNVWFDPETNERNENVFTCDDDGQVDNYIYCHDEVDEFPGPGIDYTIVEEQVFVFDEGDDVTPGDYRLISESTKILI
jgi:hypothetical protein